MNRLIVIAFVTCAAIATTAGSAGAANECRSLPVCVPVAGPWVLTGAREVEFQLACPRKFVVGGLDADISERGISVDFRGALGAPVNPGITTSTSAVFLGRLVKPGNRTPSFRPWIGCIPGSGGQRAPTSVRVGPPATRRVTQLDVLPGIQRFVVRCPAKQQLASATHAIAFYLPAPPSAQLAASVGVAQAIRDGRVYVTVRGAPELHGLRAIVQVDLLCA
ncbi:MAG TPA: hypothetical protein VM690_01070 [Gaiellaceae bacterium]|nr:hypothetical protein [Gaiellaceae bacterium]